MPVSPPLGADFHHHWWGKHADTGPGPWVREQSEHQPPPLQPSSPFQPVRSTWSQAPVLCLSLQPPSKDLCLLGQFSLQVNHEMRRWLWSRHIRQGTTPSPRGWQPPAPHLSPSQGHRSGADLGRCPWGHCCSSLPTQYAVGCQPDGSFWGCLVEANLAFPWGPTFANICFSFLSLWHII